MCGGVVVCYVLLYVCMSVCVCVCVVCVACVMRAEDLCVNSFLAIRDGTGCGGGEKTKTKLINRGKKQLCRM